MANLSNINNRFIVSDAGHVSIGNVTTNTYLVHAKSSGINNAILALESSSWSAGASAELRLSYVAGHERSIKGGYATGLEFYTNNATPAIAILPGGSASGATGNVGIGTDSPDSKLEIAAANSQVRLTDTDDSKFVLYSYSGGKLIVRNNSVNTTTNQFTLTEDGKFGIGTISPSSRLTVNKTKSGTGVENYDLIRLGLLGTGVVGDSSTIGWFSTSGTKTAGIEGISGLDNILYGELAFHVRRYTTDTYDRVMTINNRGNVGIGTDSPGYKLEVAGNIAAKAGGDVFVNSIATTTTGRSFIKNIGDTGSVLFSAIYGSASTGTLFGVSLTRAAAIVTTSDTSVHPTSLLVGTFTEIPLYLGTNNSPRITILGNGNVGIGTTEGAGGFNVNSTTAGSYYNMSNSDSGNYKYTNSGGRLLTSNATGWFADGRDPILTLSSSGNSENSAIGNSIGLNLYTNSYTYGNFSPLITFSALSDSGSYASAYAAIAGRKTNRGPDTNWNTGDLCFWTTGPEASNPASYMQQTPTMVIKSGGNVGIGTDSPGATLDVVNGGNYESIRIGNSQLANVNKQGGITALNYTGNSTSIFQYATNAGANAVYYGSADGSFRGLTQHSFMVSAGSDSVSHSQMLRINAASINAYLDQYIIKTTPTIILEGRNSGNSGAKLQFLGWANTHDNWELGNAMAGQGFQFRASATAGSTNFATVAVINSNTGVYTATSDINKKKDFEDSKIGLNEVMKLKPKLFRMKTENENLDKHLGFIAQEVKEVIPQAYLEENGKDNTKFIGIQDRPIIAALTKAIQELKAEIELLKSK